MTSNFIERVYNIQYTGSNLKVTKENYPKIYQYLEDACRILDLKKVPDLYISWDYSINAALSTMIKKAGLPLNAMMTSTYLHSSNRHETSIRISHQYSTKALRHSPLGQQSSLG